MSILGCGLDLICICETTGLFDSPAWDSKLTYPNWSTLRILERPPWPSCRHAIEPKLWRNVVCWAQTVPHWLFRKISIRPQGPSSKFTTGGLSSTNRKSPFCCAEEVMPCEMHRILLRHIVLSYLFKLITKLIWLYSYPTHSINMEGPSSQFKVNNCVLAEYNMENWLSLVLVYLLQEVYQPIVANHHPLLLFHLTKQV